MAHRRSNTATFSLFAFQDIITSVTGIMILITLLLAIELLEKIQESPQEQTAVLNDDLTIQVTKTQRIIVALEAQLELQSAELDPNSMIDAATLRSKLTDTAQDAVVVAQDAIALEKRRTKSATQLSKMEQEQQVRLAKATALRRLREELKQKKKQLKALTGSNRIIYNRTANSSKTAWVVELREDQLTVGRVGVKAKPLIFSSIADFTSWVSNISSSSNYFLILVAPSGSEEYGKLRDHLDQRGIQFGCDLIEENQFAVDPVKGTSL